MFSDGSAIIIVAGTNHSCLQISVIPSELVEPQEEINLAINMSTTSMVVLGEFTESTVTISNDEGIFKTQRNQ